MFDRLLIASNRGPVAFAEGPFGLEKKRPPGGLAPVIASAVRGRNVIWFAASSADGKGRSTEVDQIQVRFLPIDPARYPGAYERIANQTLWFAHHGIWDPSFTPAFDAAAHRAWKDFRWVDRRFARSLAGSASGSTACLIQDYHLSLSPGMLRELAPGSAIVHFSHTPFADPETFGYLPRSWRRELIEGLLGADLLGFHSATWADRFMACAATVPGVKIDGAKLRVFARGRRVQVGVFPATIDSGRLRAEVPGSVAPQNRSVKTILRVDRLDPAKNITRGFQAFEELLRLRPQWRGKVRFTALLSPSRTELPEYRRYARAVRSEVAKINGMFETASWQPIDLQVRDDHGAALRAFLDYDVLLVNALADGMNLVSMEGPALNRRDGVLILSDRTGAFARLSRYAIAIDPFDVSATAAAIDHALRMTPTERSHRARGLKRTIDERSPRDWLDEQLRMLERSKRDAAQSG